LHFFVGHGGATVNLLLIILTIIILTATGMYVLVQDWRALANRLFVFFVFVAIAYMCVAVMRLASQSWEEIWFFHGLTAPLLAIDAWLLIWLILAIFMPHLYVRRGIRWLLAMPYLIMTLFLLLDWYAGFGLVRISDGLEEGGRLFFPVGPIFAPIVALYTLGGMLAPIIMLLSVIRQNRQALHPALWLSGGIMLSFVAGAFFGELSFTGLSYVSMLPLYLAFGWVTLRYQVFRPSSVALRTAVEHLPDGIVVLDTQRRVRFANRAAQRLVSLTDAGDMPFEDALARAGFNEQTSPDDRIVDLRRFHRDGEVATTLVVSEAAIEGERGSASVLILRDMTTVEQQKAALAASRAALEERTAALECSLKEIQERDALITRLTLPLIPLSDGVLAMPLIGAFDGARCEALIALLLKRIEERSARVVLLDLTGITGFDESLAAALRQAADSARLMGAHIALCGIRPDIAESIVHERMHLNSVRLFATMQEGVAALLGHNR
jgi:anti-anti-sigma regulatory factor/PAS domain-containing protein